MKTDPIYMTDPYLKTLTTKIVESVDEGSGKFRVVLEKTIFYPMGGGQATDQGIIKTVDGKLFEVYQVMIKDGEIWNFIKSKNQNDILQVNDEVITELNWERRYHNMRLHSAGHIIDFAMYILGYSPKNVVPMKADHNKELYIMYSGVLDRDIKIELQNKIDEIVDSNISFSWGFEDFDILQKEAIYLQPNLPTNKPLRKLNLEGVGTVADGGTIVKTTSEVKGIIVTSIEQSDGNTIVKYSLDEESKNKDKVKKEVEEVAVDKIDNSDLSRKYITEVEYEIRNSKTEEELTNLWRKYLGKDGVVAGLLKDIVNIDATKKKGYGIEMNNLKTKVDTLINSAKDEIQTRRSLSYLNFRQSELTYEKPKIGHIHPLTQTINDINAIFRSLGYSIMDGPEIDTDEYNFVRTNLPSDHPARDLQDTIYIEEPNILLRTQTSSIEAHILEEYEPPFKVVMPGRVYRNEKVNKTNHFTFHQYQLVCVQEKVSLAELMSTIEYLFKRYLGEDVVIRFRSKYYPEVEPGLGPDMRCFNCEGKGCPICKHRGWIEMGGAGIRHPNMLKMAGIDPDKWQGFAFGLGLDRWAMAKHKITDIRTLLGGNLEYLPNIG